VSARSDELVDRVTAEVSNVVGRDNGSAVGMPAVEAVDTLEGFDALRPAWEQLYRADPEAHFFLSWQWLARAFARHPEEWLVLAVRRDQKGDAYSAFLPLRRHVQWHDEAGAFCSELRMAGTFFWSDYTGILCDADDETVAIPAMAAHLRQMHWRDLVLKNLRISARRLALILDQFHPSVFRVVHRQRRIKADINLLVCPCVDLPDDFDRYLTETLSSNTRQKVRRFLRKVETSDSFRITVSNRQTHHRDLDILQRLWEAKWADRKGGDTKRLGRGYRQIIEQGLQAGLVFMPVLWRDDEPLGVLCSFVDRDKREMLFFVAGRDERCNNPPPGLVLHAYSIRWAIENGFRRYDFLRGDERYKYSLGAIDREIRYLTLSTRSGRGLNKTIDPTAVDAVLRKATRYQREGRERRAETGFRQVLAVDGNNRRALRRLGRLLYRAGRLEEAEPIYTRLVAVAYDNADAWLRLGKIRLKLNAFVDAELALRKAIALSADALIDGYCSLGCALHGQGAVAEARRAFASASQLRPRNRHDRYLQAQIAHDFKPRTG